MKIKFPFYILLISIASCTTTYPALDTVAELNTFNFSGRWFEISRLPYDRESDLEKVEIEYVSNLDGKFYMVTSGFSPAEPGKKKEIKNMVKLTDPKTPGVLKISNGPFHSEPYDVIIMASNYQYALIGHPSRKQMWILSRYKTLDAITYDFLLTIAGDRGFDTSKVVRTKQ